MGYIIFLFQGQLNPLTKLMHHHYKEMDDLNLPIYLQLFVISTLIYR